MVQDSTKVTITDFLLDQVTYALLIGTNINDLERLKRHSCRNKFCEPSRKISFIIGSKM